MHYSQQTHMRRQTLEGRGVPRMHHDTIFFASKFALFATVFHFFATPPYIFATPPSFFATK
jgi:hypothetical protein